MGLLFHGMWELPGPGLKPMSSVLAGGFLTTAPPGKSLAGFFFLSSARFYYFFWIDHDDLIFKFIWKGKDLE